MEEDVMPRNAMKEAMRNTSSNEVCPEQLINVMPSSSLHNSFTDSNKDKRLRRKKSSKKKNFALGPVYSIDWSSSSLTQFPVI
eukprot:XP_765186.1 hypothetical protein [Theileria parva strain Muguga]